METIKHIVMISALFLAILMGIGAIISISKEDKQEAILRLVLVVINLITFYGMIL